MLFLLRGLIMKLGLSNVHSSSHVWWVTTWEIPPYVSVTVSCESGHAREGISTLSTCESIKVSTTLKYYMPLVSSIDGLKLLGLDIWTWYLSQILPEWSSFVESRVCFPNPFSTYKRSPSTSATARNLVTVFKNWDAQEAEEARDFMDEASTTNLSIKLYLLPWRGDHDEPLLCKSRAKSMSIVPLIMTTPHLSWRSRSTASMHPPLGTESPIAHPKQKRE